MSDKNIHKVLTLCLAAIWLVNGLFCKVLNLVPRHQQIIATILGSRHSGVFTIIIGCLEVLMAVWIISNIKSKVNAVVQILVIAVMNILECVLAPGLLLWGRANALFAFLLILVIYCNEFYLNKRQPDANVLIP